MAAANTMTLLMSRLFEEESPLKPDPLYIFHSPTGMIYSTVLKINGVTIPNISKRSMGHTEKPSNIIRELEEESCLRLWWLLVKAQAWLVTKGIFWSLSCFWIYASSFVHQPSFQLEMQHLLRSICEGNNRIIKTVDCMMMTMAIQYLIKSIKWISWD